MGEGYWRLAYVYKLLNDYVKVHEVLALADKNGVVFTESEKGIIAQILAGEPTSTPKAATTKKKK